VSLIDYHFTEENDNDPEKAEFWSLLGGFGPVKSAEAGGHDDEAPKTAKKLFKYFHLQS
jgi:hypothetical protein